MKLNIKSKILLNGLAVVVIATVMITGMLSALLWDQNVSKAKNKIQQSAYIFNSILDEKKAELQNTAEKIISNEDLSSRAGYILEYRSIAGMHDTLIEESKELAINLYSMAITTGIPKMVLYDQDGNWICLISSTNNTSLLTIPLSDGGNKYLQAEVPKGELPKNDQWHEINNAPYVPKQQKEASKKPYSSIEKFNKSLWISASSPLLIKRFNKETFKMMLLNKGSLHISLPLTKSFTEDISKLTGTPINIYTDNNFSVGLYPSQQNIHDNIEEQINISPVGNEVNNTLFSTTRIYDNDFFNGIYTISSNGKNVGKYVLYYSQQESQKDLWQILKALVICALLVLIVSSLFSLITARSIADPVIELINVMRTVSQEHNLDLRVRCKGAGEIAKAGNAFNSLMSELKMEISERLSAQKDLENHKTNLEKAVAARTAELEKKTKELIKANEHQSQFLACISHEIRTPMNGVLGMLQLLMETSTSNEQMEYLLTANNSAKSLLSLLNDLLDLSKIESGQLSIEKIPFDIRILVEDTTAFMTAKARNKTLDISCLISSKVPQEVIGDPTRIKQILTNLIENAIKFTEHGEVVVALTATENKGELPNITFEIRDTGIGIDNKTQAKIFEAFRQADSSTTRNYGGTGLGLAICKQLTEQMGGTINVVSTPGKGSRFSFTLPMERSNITSKSSLIDKIENIRILVVDDNQENRSIIESKLVSWGISFQSASENEDAKALLSDSKEIERAFDIVIINTQNPQIQGLELSDWIKRSRLFGDTKQILLSLQGHRGDASIAIESGIDAYLSLPVNDSDLYNAILSVMNLDNSEDKKLVTKHSLNESYINQNGKILVVDDDEANLTVVVNMLKNRGFRADICRNGQEAVDAVLSKRYDLVFLDCHMPILDGYSAAIKIRKSSSDYSQTPIIALTANTQKQDIIRCENSGMNGFIAKPVQFEDIDNALISYFGKDNVSKSETPSGTLLNFQLNNQSLDSTTIINLKSLIPEDETEKFINDFLLSCERRIEILWQSFRNSDLDKLLFTIDAIKSSCSNVGAIKMVSISIMLENQLSTIEDGDDIPKDVEGIIENLELEIKELKKKLPQELSSRSS